MRGRLEREIRLLPQVLACSVTPEGVFVLVSPSGDPWVTNRAARAIMARAGATGTLRVAGGTALTSASLLPTPRLRAASLAGAVAGAALLAVASLAGGITRGPEAPERSSPAGRAVERIDLRPVVAARSSHGPAPADPASEAVSTTGDVVRVGAPVPANHAAAPDSADGAIAPPAARPPALPSPTSETQDEECPGPPDRSAPRDQSGQHRGDGPREWSFSVLVEPHDTCDRGRP